MSDRPSLRADGRENPSINPFRALPSVDRLMRDPSIRQLVDRYGDDQVLSGVRDVLERAREQIRAGAEGPEIESWSEAVEQVVRGRTPPTLLPLINATGVIVHTNLGRAPLSSDALQAVRDVSSGYASLEYDLDAGRRGSRHEHTRGLLRELTGAEDAIVVNNNAAAVFFVLAVLCQGSDVLVSRGELVEIGGGFRIPDVLRQSGARLVEVGTTNRTHAADFTDAVGESTAALLRIHPSNFRQMGFVTMPSLAECVDALDRSYGSPRPLVLDDLGSGTLLDTARFGLAPEPMVQESVEAGADLVMFSGDKLLGGPQAGIIVGREELIQRLRRHPLARALRVDKMTLAALDATLRSYVRGRALEEVPVWRMIATDIEALQSRAKALRRSLLDAGIDCAEPLRGESTVGGGSLPGETLPTSLLGLSLSNPDGAASRLRKSAIPIICRIQNDQLLVDLRTVLPEQEPSLLQALVQIGENQ